MFVPVNAMFECDHFGPEFSNSRSYASSASSGLRFASVAMCATIIPQSARKFLMAVYCRFCLESLQSGAFEAASALYANLAKGLFARFYGKLLIPRLGT